MYNNNVILDTNNVVIFQCKKLIYLINIKN